MRTVFEPSDEQEGDTLVIVDTEHVVSKKMRKDEQEAMFEPILSLTHLVWAKMFGSESLYVNM